MKFLFFIIILSTFAIADYSGTYTIVGKDVIVEEMITFDSFVSEYKWRIPADAQAIEVDGLTFRVNSVNDLVITGSLFNFIHLKYITSSPLERTADSFFLLSTGHMDGDLTVILPEEATLKYSLNSAKPSIIPSANVSTDGRRVIVSWNQPGDSVMIIYEEADSNMVEFIAGIVILLLLLLLIRLKIGRGSVTRNLFEEEKAIVELLMKAKDKELWQKQLALESGLSKVKLSRRLRNLVAKDVIEKIPYGNTNKIRLK